MKEIRRRQFLQDASEEVYDTWYGLRFNKDWEITEDDEVIIQGSKEQIMRIKKGWLTRFHPAGGSRLVQKIKEGGE